MRAIVTGASRGIGKEIACEIAKMYPRSSIVLMARSLQHPNNNGARGTLLDTARCIEAAGSCAIPLKTDMGCPISAEKSFKMAINSLGGLDVLVTTSSAFVLGDVPSVKNINLVCDVNIRGSMIAFMSCLPSLCKSKGSVLTLAPPLDLERRDLFSENIAYTISKYGMTLLSLAAAERGIRSNTIWPRQENNGRDPKHFARAACVLLSSNRSGEMLLDDDLVETPPTHALS